VPEVITIAPTTIRNDATKIDAKVKILFITSSFLDLSPNLIPELIYFTFDNRVILPLRTVFQENP